MSSAGPPSAIHGVSRRGEALPGLLAELGNTPLVPLRRISRPDLPSIAGGWA